MSFSATFPAPINVCSKTSTGFCYSFASWPSMAANLIPSLKSSLAASKSTFLRHNLTMQSSISHGVFSKARFSSVSARAATEKSIHDFTVKDIDGKDVSLNKFKGKVLLIVNVASRWYSNLAYFGYTRYGLTTANYSELSHLYEKYKAQGQDCFSQCGGVNVLKSPGWRFWLFLATNLGAKNLGPIQKSSSLPAQGSRPSSQFLTRIAANQVDVNGPNTAPVYQFLKSSAGGFLGDLIKWNFEKFLVDKNGKVVERYPPTTSPFQIEKDIQKLVAA
uniref:Glutathione peroxidase n=1 Tax=Cucumis melo TaxID=3656 RepID=A0A9I9DE00_CUCME